MGVISINKKLKPFASEDYRYYVAYGGRGSAKSWSVARILLLISYQRKIRVLCAREIQHSIKDSVHKLLSDQIDILKLDGFGITNDAIRHTNGSEFIFTGLYTNLSKIKSLEGIDYCWIEEAESISSLSWEILDPTIRKPKSKIFITFNPRYEDDVIYKSFILNKPENAFVVKVNWSDNKHFPLELKAQKDHMARVDPELYMHIWEGEIKKNTNELIFSGKWRVQNFEAAFGTHFYFGADWGFSQDPNTLIRCFIKDDFLYIDYEVNDKPYDSEIKIQTDIEKLPELWNLIPKVKDFTITADSARPETISYMNSKGFCVVGAIKGKGSVEDGITYLRSFEQIIIHPRCKNTIYEFANYKFKVDPRSGQITHQIVDKYNHHIDAIRYALEANMGNNIYDYEDLI